ncbi:deoxynucleoside kinase [Candidatus Gottesmanbacteria bacterium]|nr:deoxynucleoside kinase [Candidatus Gottesmanbacteria bacterium]
MTHPFISVMGNIGSGKTTLDRCIARYLKFHLVEENVANNLFLADFYKDMHRWAFHSQTYYLTEKIKQMLAIKEIIQKKPVVQDTSIYQDVFVFAEAQYEAGNMSQPEFDLYQKIYAMWEKQLPTPDLIIYLKTSVEVVEERINKRARNFEAKVPRWYLVLLNWLLDRWVSHNKKIPILTIETDGVNIVDSKKDIEKVISLIKEKLK